MAQPVFVIGRIRSGTKWLSNLLGAHPEVAAISGRRAGLLSTCMFDRLPDTFGSLKDDSNFYAFLACYSKTDFFRLTGLPEEFLYRLDTRNYFEIFRQMMDAYAQRSGRALWVQKSKSILLPQLYENFPDARFVIIRRNLMDNIRSSIGLALSHGDERANTLTTALSYYHHVKTEERYRGRENVYFVEFEELKADTVGTMKRVCAFLGIEFRPEMLDTGYAPNTSFSEKIKRERMMRRRDLILLGLAEPVISRLPVTLLDRFFRLKTGFRKMPYRETRLSANYFNMLKQELAEGSFPSGSLRQDEDVEVPRPLSRGTAP